MNDTEKTRWFSDSYGIVREYPSRRVWVHGALMRGKAIWSMHTCIGLGFIELDGPPPHGKPISKATGDRQ